MGGMDWSDDEEELPDIPGPSYGSYASVFTTTSYSSRSNESNTPTNVGTIDPKPSTSASQKSDSKKSSDGLTPARRSVSESSSATRSSEGTTRAKKSSHGTLNSKKSSPHDVPMVLAKKKKKKSEKRRSHSESSSMHNSSNFKAPPPASTLLLRRTRTSSTGGSTYVVSSPAAVESEPLERRLSSSDIQQPSKADKISSMETEDDVQQEVNGLSESHKSSIAKIKKGLKDKNEKNEKDMLKKRVGKIKEKFKAQRALKADQDKGKKHYKRRNAFSVHQKRPQTTRSPEPELEEYEEEEIEIIGKTWRPNDDLRLIINTLLTYDLKQVHMGVKFSCNFSFEDIKNRWATLLRTSKICQVAVTACRNIHSKVKHKIFSEALLSPGEIAKLQSVKSTDNPTLETFQKLLDEEILVFNNYRTAALLMKRWNTLKDMNMLCDQDIKKSFEGGGENFSNFENSVDDGFVRGVLIDPAILDEIIREDRRNKKRIRMLESEVDMWQYLAELVYEAQVAKTPQFDDNTFAILRGEKVKFAMAAKEITLGRRTDDNWVDANLSEESNDFKVSRRQATIKMRALGDFVILNQGRHPIYVDGNALSTGEVAMLFDNSVIKVSDLNFVFLVNQRLVDDSRKKILEEESVADHVNVQGSSSKAKDSSCKKSFGTAQNLAEKLFSENSFSRSIDMNGSKSSDKGSSENSDKSGHKSIDKSSKGKNGSKTSDPYGSKTSDPYGSKSVDKGSLKNSEKNGSKRSEKGGTTKTLETNGSKNLEKNGPKSAGKSGLKGQEKNVSKGSDKGVSKRDKGGNMNSGISTDKPKKAKPKNKSLVGSTILENGGPVAAESHMLPKKRPSSSKDKPSAKRSSKSKIVPEAGTPHVPSTTVSVSTTTPATTTSSAAVIVDAETASCTNSCPPKPVILSTPISDSQSAPISSVGTSSASYAFSENPPTPTTSVRTTISFSAAGIQPAPTVGTGIMSFPMTRSHPVPAGGTVSFSSARNQPPTAVGTMSFVNARFHPNAAIGRLTFAAPGNHHPNQVGTAAFVGPGNRLPTQVGTVTFAGPENHVPTQVGAVTFAGPENHVPTQVGTMSFAGAGNQFRPNIRAMAFTSASNHPIAVVRSTSGMLFTSSGVPIITTGTPTSSMPFTSANAPGTFTVRPASTVPYTYSSLPDTTVLRTTTAPFTSAPPTSVMGQTMSFPMRSVGCMPGSNGTFTRAMIPVSAHIMQRFCSSSPGVTTMSTSTSAIPPGTCTAPRTVLPNFAVFTPGRGMPMPNTMTMTMMRNTPVLTATTAAAPTSAMPAFQTGTAAAQVRMPPGTSAMSMPTGVIRHEIPGGNTISQPPPQATISSPPVTGAIPSTTAEMPSRSQF